MSILADKNTKILVQGITGVQASFHVKRAMASGTNVVAGVSPNKGGTIYNGVPVFATVKEAVAATGATASMMFVPARFLKSAAREAIEAELDLAVTITEGVPIRDMLEIKAMLKGSKTILIGPNTPGVIVPEQASLGFFPEIIHHAGDIGIVSRSSTLTYGHGQSTVVGLGDDMIVGTDFVEILKRFHQDDATSAIVMLGNTGGMYEELAAEYYAGLVNKKPVITYIAGVKFPLDYKIGYAGDIITHGKITAEDKKAIMRKSGMIVVDSVNDIHTVLRNLPLK